MNDKQIKLTQNLQVKYSKFINKHTFSLKKLQ